MLSQLGDLLNRAIWLKLLLASEEVPKDGGGAKVERVAFFLGKKNLGEAWVFG